MKKLYIIALLLLCLAIPAQAAQEMKDYLVKGMQDYELTNQTKNYNQLTINSTDPKSKRTEKTIHEGNLVFSKYDYRGDKSAVPSNLQILRYYMSAVSKLGGEVLWEDGSNFHATFTRSGKQYYMAAVSYGSSYEVRVLEIAKLNSEVETVDADYVFKSMADYELTNQTRKFEQLTINSTEPKSNKVEKTVYEGNLVFSRYDYRGDKITMPGNLQILRSHQLAVAKLGGETLWEDSSSTHASFTRGGKKYYMTMSVWSNGGRYEVWMLEVADLNYDVELLFDDEDIIEEEVLGGNENTDAGSVVDKLKGLIKKKP